MSFLKSQQRITQILCLIVTWRFWSIDHILAFFFFTPTQMHYSDSSCVEGKGASGDEHWDCTRLKINQSFCSVGFYKKKKKKPPYRFYTISSCSRLKPELSTYLLVFVTSELFSKYIRTKRWLLVSLFSHLVIFRILKVTVSYRRHWKIFPLDKQNKCSFPMAPTVFKWPMTPHCLRLSPKFGKKYCNLFPFPFISPAVLRTDTWAVCHLVLSL